MDKRETLEIPSPYSTAKSSQLLLGEVESFFFIGVVSGNPGWP